MRRALYVWVCLVFLGLGFASAQAHTKSQSFSSWGVQGSEIVMVFQVDARRVTLLSALDDTARPPDELLSLHLMETMEVVQAEAPCRLDGVPTKLRAADGYRRMEMRFQCPTTGTFDGVSVTNGAFFPVSAQHVHFARARDGNGGWREIIFSDTARTQSFSAIAGGETGSIKGPAFITYTILGIQHILEGIDHLAFLAALLLLSQNLRQILFVVTGFTIGHSVTLALAALGVISPNVPVIEALIGFTIAFVAAEVLAKGAGQLWRVALVSAAVLGILAFTTLVWGGALSVVVWLGLILFVVCYGRAMGAPGDAERFAPVLTIGFGLVHGAGFANVLNEIGLPTDRLVWALLGFNVGVELGQLFAVAVLGVVWTIAARVLSQEKLRDAARYSATLLLAMGVFWFVDRAF